MIVRDEAAVLERCLQSVAHLVDEIIIVDTGSIDETKTIAAAFTPHLYEFPWQDDFSAARKSTAIFRAKTILSGRHDCNALLCSVGRTKSTALHL